MRNRPLLRMSKAQKRRFHQRRLQALWLHARRERERHQRFLWKTPRGFCMTVGSTASAQSTRGSACDITAMQNTSTSKAACSTDDMGAHRMSSPISTFTYPDSCGQAVATACSVQGGYRDHRLFWAFQHQQSGGRRTFQHMHDPAWLDVDAGKVQSAVTSLQVPSVPDKSK